MTFAFYQSLHFRLICKRVTHEEKTQLVLCSPAWNKWVYSQNTIIIVIVLPLLWGHGHTCLLRGEKTKHNNNKPVAHESD